MKKQLNALAMIILLMAMGLAACAGIGASGSDGGDGGTGGELPPEAAVKAREALSAELGVGIEAITIISHERATWMDSCLGLGGIAESCLRTDVPGWLVELAVEDNTYTARTDELGDQVRFEQ